MLANIGSDLTFDESTVREYETKGLVLTQKIRRNTIYKRSADTVLPEATILDLSSKILPCGGIGPFLFDKIGPYEEHFSFKHHYITGPLDSEILCALFTSTQ